MRISSLLLQSLAVVCACMCMNDHFEKHEATFWRRTKVENPNADVGENSHKRGCLAPEGEAVSVSRPSVWSGSFVTSGIMIRQAL